MWTVIYIAPNRATAEKYGEHLEQEGIFVQLRAVSRKETPQGMVEIQVPQSEAEEAHEILTSIMNKI
ncbi:MAG: glutamate decarboxylase [Peptococcaceae bacterium]|nr:glutamate decarboxylase [Peptococcaceae bacterium]